MKYYTDKRRDFTPPLSTTNMVSQWHQIVWAEIDYRSGELKGTLLVSHFNGRSRQRFDTPFVPLCIGAR